MKKILISLLMLLLFSCSTTNDDLSAEEIISKTELANKPYHYLTVPEIGGGSGFDPCVTNYSFALNNGNFFSGQKLFDGCSKIKYHSSYSTSQLIDLQTTIEKGSGVIGEYSIQNKNVTNPSQGVFNINLYIKKTIKNQYYTIDSTGAMNPAWSTEIYYFNKNIYVNTLEKTIY